MSFLVFVEDIFAPEVTAVTLKTWIFFHTCPSTVSFLV